jgi:hypothetical protein
MQMQPTALSNAAVRKALHLTLLLFVISLVTSCEQSNQSRTESGSQLRPASSPAPSPRPTPSAPGGDTIIVIKDGSTTLEDIDTDCTLISDGKYKCANTVLKRITIQPTVGSGSPVTCLITDPNPVVKVDAGGEENDIMIKGTGNDVTIDFDKTVYADCGPKKHCNADNHVWLVRIKKGGACGVCRPEEKCTVTFSKS